MYFLCTVYLRTAYCDFEYRELVEMGWGGNQGVLFQLTFTCLLLFPRRYPVYVRIAYMCTVCTCVYMCTYVLPMYCLLYYMVKLPFTKYLFLSISRSMSYVSMYCLCTAYVLPVYGICTVYVLPVYCICTACVLHM